MQYWTTGWIQNPFMSCRAKIPGQRSHPEPSVGTASQQSQWPQSCSKRDPGELGKMKITVAEVVHLVGTPHHGVTSQRDSALSQDKLWMQTTWLGHAVAQVGTSVSLGVTAFPAISYRLGCQSVIVPRYKQCFMRTGAHSARAFLQSHGDRGVSAGDRDVAPVPSHLPLGEGNTTKSPLGAAHTSTLLLEAALKSDWFNDLHQLQISLDFTLIHPQTIAKIYSELYFIQ